ncbi:maltase A3 isoform X1 [Nilaparvata lugens]|uniref:maltase A3 isoform X1 n=2 Tax=Nilaparvata lugens TaxID=108931 RepID=UPI00193CF68D|nr:maltase A3 isoform X1 [Nilaparvata lugens]
MHLLQMWAIMHHLLPVALLLLSTACYVNCQQKLDWWQTSTIYQVYPRSFKDSNGDGIGDLKGIEQMADYFKEIGVGAVWLSPIFKSPMADFGYDISDYRQIDPAFGTLNDFKSLAKKLKSLGIKLLLDFVPNHSSDEHEWFKRSVKREKPYDDFYVWKDAKGFESGKPIPPNNWISVFNINPMWTWNEERRQFYLHQFLNKQPDLNYRNEDLKREMQDILTFWLSNGVDGFRVDAVPFLVEESSFRDEAYVDESKAKDMYANLNHTETMDQPETFQVIRSWRRLMDNFTDTHKTDRKVMLTEAYTDLKKTMWYYGNKTHPISQMPFNFELLTKITPQSDAITILRTVDSWLQSMPEGMWANWVIGNHDNPRVAKRFGAEMTDAFNMLVTLLPGTAVTYYGEELGMEDVFVRWDQAKDPAGIVLGKDKYLTVTRDSCRSPMQWSDAISAGFSKTSGTWLPVNPNYWHLNVENQRKAERSHLKTYKHLMQARQTATIQKGQYHGYNQGDGVFIFTRTLAGEPSYVVIMNLNTEIYRPDLSKIEIPGSPKKLYVYTSSLNSAQKRGDVVMTSGRDLELRPKASLVLTSQTVKPEPLTKSSSNRLTSLVPQTLVVMVVCHLISRLNLS